MGKIRKVLALVIAMVMCMGITAMAADTFKITITKNADNDDHTYAAYQIIKGDLDTDKESPTYGQLQNLVWGTGVDGADLLNALKADSTIGSKFNSVDSTAASVASAMAECTSQAEVEALAAVLGAYTESANLASVGSYANNVISGLEQGYYFVKDTTPDADLTYDTKSEFMLQVVGDTEVKAKDSTVSLEKKVDDKNDSTATEDAIFWQDTADYDVGDVIPYRLKGTLPSNYDKFDYFTYEFSDTMSAGLTLNEASVKVVYYANAEALTADTTATSGNDITAQFTIGSTSDADGKTTLTIKKTAVVAQDGTVTNAGLKAITGITKDSVIVVYYNATLNDNAVVGNPGNDNTAKLKYSNNPNNTGDGDTTSETPEDTNIVFTYTVNVNKFNEKSEPLAGATFALYKEVVGEVAGAETGSAIKTALGNDIKADALKDASKYVVVGTVEATKADDATNYTASFNKVDDGNYVLVETVVPAGYNAWDAKEFTIVATHTQDDSAKLELTELKSTGNLEMTGDLSNGTAASGSMSTDITNNSGSTLPSTGGMGTTIFYVIGGILVLAAAIILISKRRVQQ